MPEYIEREALIEKILSISVIAMGVRSGKTLFYEALKSYREAVLKNIKEAPTADVVEVVRCKNCKFATEFDKHCEINQAAYRHCTLWRGDLTRNVWHKYKKYYQDYSVVDLDGFCSEGERKEVANSG